MISEAEWAKEIKPEWSSVPGSIWPGSLYNRQEITPMKYGRLLTEIRQWFDWNQYKAVVRAKAILRLQEKN